MGLRRFGSAAVDETPARGRARFLVKRTGPAALCAQSTSLRPSIAAPPNLGPDTSPRARSMEEAVVVRGLSLAGRRRLIQLGRPGGSFPGLYCL